MLGKIKVFILHLFEEQASKVENSNPYGCGLLKGYEDYYGSGDEQ